MPSHQRVYLVAQERQDGVSNWLCVQVMLPQLRALQHHLGRVEKKNEGRHHEKKRKKRKRKRERVKKNVSHLRKITTAVL